MSIKSCFLFITLLLHTVAGLALENQLKDHPSPYLELHENDPVAWQDWTTDAVALATKEQKLVYMSIGYFSCHWCHVMQRESYQNEEIAETLNSNFIPVKIDRELEPALDARMIEFVQSTQGRAGWPLNVFLTPDGHPLYAVLYLPSQNFHQVLVRLAGLWQKDRENLITLAKREGRQAKGPGAPTLDVKSVESMTKIIADNLERIADKLQGGFGSQNKFPMAPQLEFLLEDYKRNPNPELKAFLTLTFDQMAANGMYDHVGDGFFRYTIDPGWETPHFEKMLYDNAQLARLYLNASVVFDVPKYEAVARRTLDFMLRDMAAEDGAMVASFSAVDQKDVEGGYYLWSNAELAKILSATEQEIIKHAWNLDGPLRFEAGYLPTQGMTDVKIAEKLKFDTDKVTLMRLSAQEKLQQARTLRVLPTDTKLLAGWNGLALRSLSHAARVLGETRYQEGAQRIRDYIFQTLWDGKSLRRAVDGKRALGKASLQDYAYVSDGLLAWAELTGTESDYALALAVVQQAWSRFYGKGWRLAEESLIENELAQDLIADGPMPSPAAVIARVSLQLAYKNKDQTLEQQALGALNSGISELRRNGFWHASHINAMIYALSH